MKRTTAPFGVTIRQKKVGYCNRNIIPLLKKRRIAWDMTPMRIIFCGRRFFMGSIDNGDAEEFIRSLPDGQTTLDFWR